MSSLKTAKPLVLPEQHIFMPQVWMSDRENHASVHIPLWPPRVSKGVQSVHLIATDLADCSFTMIVISMECGRLQQNGHFPTGIYWRIVTITTIVACSSLVSSSCEGDFNKPTGQRMPDSACVREKHLLYPLCALS